jgi:hypothetical protein
VTAAENGLVFLIGWFASFIGWAVWAKLLRRREPRGLVITTMYQGAPATAVRGLENFVPTAVPCGALAASFAWGGLLAWSTERGQTVFGLGMATYFGIAAWLLGSGRVGDGTVWFTRDGLSQRAKGLEQSIRWDDLVAMRPERGGVELDSCAPIKAHRFASRAWVGRARSVDPTMKLLIGNLPRVHLVRAIDTWVTDGFARLEIGTPEAVERLLGPRV